MSIEGLSGPGASGGRQSSVDADRWQLQPGDTLCGIARARQAQGMAGSVAALVRELVRLNRLSDPDRIEVGQLLRLPSGAPGVRPPMTDLVEPAVGGGATPLTPLRAEERRALLEGALFGLARTVRGAEPAATDEPRRASDGTPLFRQGDPAWRAERLGVDAVGPTLARAGCAVTACAMAFGRLSGQTLTPGALLRKLREAGGFRGALVDWSCVGTVLGGGLRATPAPLDRVAVDQELDAGRPVLLRVLHGLEGSPRQHWICLTGRDARAGTYAANDPATGRTTVLRSTAEGLVSAGGEPVRYASDDRMVTFARPAAPARTS